MVGLQLGVWTIRGEGSFFPCERVVPAPPSCDVAGDRGSICYCSTVPGDECVSDGLGLAPRAGAGGQPGMAGRSHRPALRTWCSPPRRPAGTRLGVGSLLGRSLPASASPDIEPWGDLPDGEGALPWAPAAPSPARVDTGAGGMLQPNRRPRLCPSGQPRLGCSRRPSPGDAALRGCGAGGAPAPHLQPTDGKPGLAGGPRAAARTRPAGLHAASVSTWSVPRGQGLRSVSHTQAAALTSPRAGAAPHVPRSPKAPLTRHSGPMVGPLRYRGTGIAPVAANGSLELLLALAPAKIISPVPKPEGNRWRGPAGDAAAWVSPPVLAVRLVGLARFPWAPAGWDRPLAEVIQSPFHLPRARDVGRAWGDASWLPGARCPRNPRAGRGVVGILGSRPRVDGSGVSREGRVNPPPTANFTGNDLTPGSSEPIVLACLTPCQGGSWNAEPGRAFPICVRRLWFILFIYFCHLVEEGRWTQAWEIQMCTAPRCCSRRAGPRPQTRWARASPAAAATPPSPLGRVGGTPGHLPRPSIHTTGCEYLRADGLSPDVQPWTAAYEVLATRWPGSNNRGDTRASPAAGHGGPGSRHGAGTRCGTRCLMPIPVGWCSALPPCPAPSLCSGGVFTGLGTSYPRVQGGNGPHKRAAVLGTPSTPRVHSLMAAWDGGGKPHRAPGISRGIGDVLGCLGCGAGKPVPFWGSFTPVKDSGAGLQLAPSPLAWYGAAGGTRLLATGLFRGQTSTAKPPLGAGGRSWAEKEGFWGGTFEFSRWFFWLGLLRDTRDDHTGS